MSLRLIRIAFALFLGLVLCEVVLGGLHLIFGVGARGGEGGAEVLCIGDSHTFGWNVDAESAWPARLERLLAADGLDWNVANRGAPGKNTETLLGELDEYLALDQPRVVLILAGLNNPWSRPHGEGAGHLFDGWRTASLVRVLLQSVGGGGRIQASGEVAGDGHFEEHQGADGRTTVSVVNREGDLENFKIGGGSLKEHEQQLGDDWVKGDLVAIADKVRSAGATPVLLTYALETGIFLGNANFSIREAAVEGDIDLIDVAALFKPEIEGFGEQRLFFADAHPRREGYSAVARGIHDQLVGLGLVEGPPVGDPFAELRAQPAPRPQLELLPSGGAGLELRVDYEPGLEFSLLLAGGLAAGATDAAELDWFGLAVPLARDTIFESSSPDEALRGSFAGEPVVVRLSAEQLEAWGAGSGPLFGVLVGRTAHWSVLDASEPLRLR